MNLQTRIAIYARVSSDQQVQQATIESQLAAVQKFATDNGLKIDPDLIFADNGFSGITLARPQLDALRDQAATGEINRILILDPDRLARKYAHQLMLIEEFKKLGVEMTFVNRQIAASPEDQLLLQIQGVIAEYEREKILERQRRGKLHKAQQGKVSVLAAAPYGYVSLPATKTEDTRYEIHEGEAEVVKQIFDMLVEQGLSLGAIARQLTQDQVPTRHNTGRWQRSVIRDMLLNPAYIGRAAYRKTKAVERLRAYRPSDARSYPKYVHSSTRNRPPEEWITVPVPAIVSEALFQRVHQRLEENKRFSSRNNKKYDYLLTGLLICQECGYRLYGKPASQSKRNYYRCLGQDGYRWKEGRLCSTHPVRVEVLDDLVWKQTRRLLEQPELVLQEYSARIQTKQRGEDEFKALLTRKSGGIRAASCNCDYNFGGHCKHIVALLLTFTNEPEQFAVREDPAELLADLDREQLVALLAKVMRERPELYDTVEAAMALSKAGPPATSKRKTPAARRKKVDVEPYRRRVRGIMHSLDRMRTSEAYWHVGGLTDELRGVEKTAMEFLDAGDAETALRILLTLLEESYDGFNYIDDSDGYLGDYLSSLGETLAEVILSFDPDEDQREVILKDLEKVDRALSSYGVEGLEVAITAIQRGWNERQHDAEDRSAERADDEEWDDGNDEGNFVSSGYGAWAPESPSQVLTRAKLNVLERQGRTDEYLALCLQSGAHLRYAQKLVALNRVPEAMKYALKHLADAGEALKLAQHLREAGHFDESLKIGEGGLKLGGSKAALGGWLGPIEETQGRTSQALEAWQVAFHDSPSLATWQTIKRLAGSLWKKINPELMASLEKGYTHQPLVEVLLEEQEWDAAIKVADKQTYSYRLVATVADALIVHRPQWVIRASIKQADELLAKSKSKYHSHAADWLRRAKTAYTQMGQTNEWQKYLQKLKEQYKRRPALMAQLERL